MSARFFTPSAARPQPIRAPVLGIIDHIMNNRAETKKTTLLSEMTAVREKILAAAAEIPPPLRKEPFLGHWNILDLLAHLAGWDDANRQAIDAIRAGQLPDFYQYAERNWVTFNERLVAQYRLDDLDALSDRVRDTQRQLVAALESVPAEEFDRDFNVRFRKYKVTIGRLLLAEVHDEKKHLNQVNQIAGLTRGITPKSGPAA